MSFLDVNIIRELGKFTTSGYRKPTFSGIYTHFDSLLLSTYKLSMIPTLLYRCFQIWSDWTKFLVDLANLMDVFKSNGYPVNFINNCFKTFLDSKHRIQGKLITVPKKPLFLVFPYLGPLWLQTRAKFRKSFKGIPHCCKSRILLKSQNKLANAYGFKDRSPKEIASAVVYKFQCGLCNEYSYGECVRHLNVRTGEHIEISPLTKKKVKSKCSAVSNHLLLCNHSPCFGSFSVLTKENREFALELKDILLIMRDKLSLIRNIRPATLYLFDRI